MPGSRATTLASIVETDLQSRHAMEHSTQFNVHTTQQPPARVEHSSH